MSFLSYYADVVGLVIIGFFLFVFLTRTTTACKVSIIKHLQLGSFSFHGLNFVLTVYILSRYLKIDHMAKYIILNL